MKTTAQDCKRALMLLGLAVTVAIAGCGSDSPMQSQAPSTTQPNSQGESFTAWSKNAVFPKPAESAPETMDAVVFNFDGDEDPNAYAELLPSAM